VKKDKSVKNEKKPIKKNQKEGKETFQMEKKLEKKRQNQKSALGESGETRQTQEKKTTKKENSRAKKKTKKVLEDQGKKKTNLDRSRQTRVGGYQKNPRENGSRNRDQLTITKAASEKKQSNGKETIKKDLSLV